MSSKVEIYVLFIFCVAPKSVCVVVLDFYFDIYFYFLIYSLGRRKGKTRMNGGEVI